MSTLVVNSVNVQLATRKVEAADAKLKEVISMMLNLNINEIVISQLRRSVPGLALLLADYDNDYEALVAEYSHQQLKIAYTEKVAYDNGSLKSEVRMTYDELVVFSKLPENRVFSENALKQAGLTHCLDVMYDTGSFEFWQHLMGYNNRGFRVETSRGRPRIYTAEVIVEILDSLSYIQKGVWPSQRQFKEAKDFRVDSLGRDLSSLDSLRQTLYNMERKYENCGFFAHMYGVENHSYNNYFRR